MPPSTDPTAAEDTKWLIARELPRLRRFARALRNDGGADDLVQDCVERALRKIDLWQQGTNMRAWLFRILYNLHLSTMRSTARLPPTVSLDDLDLRASAGAGQQATVELRELAEAMHALPAEQRDVVVLVALEGMRYDEAAEVLGVPLGTVRSRLSRARTALRDAVAGHVSIAPDAIAQREAIAHRPQQTGTEHPGHDRREPPRLRRVK